MKVRVALIGCGAVAQQFHIPILAGHERVRLVGLADRDLDRAAELGARYKISRVVADANELEADAVDAVVIATPPVHHAPCTIELARRGIHVFVEKPMARNAEEATAMIRAAEEAGVVLSVGLFRRLLPSTRLLRAVIDSGVLGRPVSFDVDEGAVYGWEAVTLGNMRKELAGGGVLIDVGSHAIDRMLHILPGPAEVLEYEHNSYGGVESDCRLRLRIQHQGGPIEGQIQLSRTRRLRNTVQVRCERGLLEVAAGERFQVDIFPDDRELSDCVQDRLRQVKLQAGWSDEIRSEWWEIFRAELDDWLDAIVSGKSPQLSGKSALPTVGLIDTCYRIAQPLREPGIDEALHGPISARPASRSTTSLPSGPRVLVTGATGFIGCRVAEILSLREGCDVRALVHTPANASRLARLPVEMVVGDLSTKEDSLRLVDSVDAIVHCAIAPPWASLKETRRVTVDGTRNLAEAALATGIGRFVHLSSFGIHGNDVRGTIDESTPVRPPKGDKYCEAKAASERIVQRCARHGLPVVILRPTNVYGPWSKTFIVRPIEYLKRERLILAGSADMPSNTVYVDNLVDVVCTCLWGPSHVCGEIFLVSDGDDFTWGQFFGYFADAIGKQLRTAPLPTVVRDISWPGHSLRDWASRWMSCCRQIVTSAEFKELGRRILDTDPIGRVPREFLQASPRLRGWVLRRLGTSAATVYHRPEIDAVDVFRFRSRAAVASIEKARRVMGYSAAISREEGLQRVLDWLQYARII